VDGLIGSLMDMYLEGRFPFDKLVRTFALSDINEAIASQHRGECVKAVLLP
jgi:aryl-alcohol dehydrogenase